MGAACNNKTEKGKSYPTYVGEGQSISIESSADTTDESSYIFPDTLQLEIDANGKMHWQKEDSLQKELQDSLLSLYLHTRKLPSQMEVRFTSPTNKKTQKTTREMIGQAQRLLIYVISVKELNKSYNDLDEKSKEKFRKQYPLLFQ